MPTLVVEDHSHTLLWCVHNADITRDDGGALEPEEAAKILADWIEKDFSLDKTGEYWAPRGTRDIGNWEVVVGKDKTSDKPVKLPW